MVDLSLNLIGLTLAHPMMLGSGPVGVRANDLIKYGRVAGAIVTKSITPMPSAGSKQPRIVKIDHDGMLNYEGGPNPGIDAFAATLREVVPQIPCPVIGSMSPRALRHENAIESQAEKFVAAGVKAIELDFKYLYDEAAGRTDFRATELSLIVRRVRRAVEVPVIAKLAVGAVSLEDLAAAAEDGGAAAISAINTLFPAMKISLRNRKPVLSTKFGGLSGAPIRSLAIATIYRLRQITKLPLIGIGGIFTAEDIVEFLLAGASAVQIYTAAQLHGPGLFEELKTGLAALCAQLGAASVGELTGGGHAEDEERPSQ